MGLREAITEGKFIITCELEPPKGTDVSNLAQLAKELNGLVDAINLTDGQGANMRMCPMAAAQYVLKEGIDVIWQLTCRDRNRIGLQADCLGASALGIRNVLPMRGDDPKGGDHPEAKPVFDLNTTELITVLNKLNNGFDMAGKELNGKTNFFIGCTAHPNAPDLLKQRETLEERFSIGAGFIQTQICYEVEQLKKFVDSIGNDLAKKTIIGITPLKSLKMANFMNEKVFGVTVPDDIIKKIESSEDAKLEGLEIAKAIVDEIRKLNIGGIHVMAVGQTKELPKIIHFLTKQEVSHKTQ
ncbi:MAG: methylenetetrahydrofolate reductase [Candidatus Melainabacteria bacterium]|nr:methylenetetrahydrofolate reductase [Candidatus Melainabacteria bacterium]MBI3307810.1 methylenetetrahydrofolate reductase [Candidatus Melainabacteria bacterium]